MKRLWSFVALVCFCLPLSAEESGLEIMKKQKERHRLPYETEKVTMILKDDQGRIKERSMTIYSMEDSAGLHKAMIQFTQPQDVRQVGLLTWEQRSGEDDQWLYLPDQGRSKRIVAGGKKNAFMGTDLAYEDLRAENLDTHSYTLTGSQTLEGHECYVIEALPATDQEKRESGYDKRVLWVRKDILMPIKTEFYSRNRLVKTALSHVTPIQGEIWRVQELVVADPKRGTSTTMRTETRQVDSIDPSFFTTRFLENPVR